MPGAFDMKQQLVFYGSYHNNPVNVWIHMIFVPIIMWTSMIMIAAVPTPEWFPSYRHDFNSLLSFEVNWSTVITASYIAYYLMLFPVAAVMYAPQQIMYLLTATTLARDPYNVKLALAAHVASWLFQFYGHGKHEGRAPALLDNIVGALFLAPFFVHLEVLFKLGYFEDLHQNIQKSVDVEIAKFKTAGVKKTKAT